MEFVKIEYPIDSEGYAESFDDPKDWINIMKKYNVLVVPILNNEECDELEEDMWKSVGPKVTKDPTTWENKNWPNPNHPFLIDQYATSKTAFKYRTHGKLERVFTELYNTKDVITTIDFYGIKRATILPEPIGERKDWRMKPLKLHWDCYVNEYVQDQLNKKIRYQALIAVNDNCQSTGSFSCVIGSANILKEWNNLYEPENKKYVSQNNILQKHTQRIPIRKGCVIIWDFGVAHSNFSNYSSEPRLTMYCRMIPNQQWSIDKERQSITKFWHDNPNIKKEVSSYEWNLREMKILGLL